MRDATWQQRDVATAPDVDFDTRMMEVRIATVNENDRSVEAVLSTDQPVEMFDWRKFELIDEILLTEGAQIPRQMPLLAVHNRWELDDVLGSIRSIKTEDGNGDARQIVGRLHFAENDESADRAWNKVRQGHLTDVSVGYRILESTEIQKGQTTEVAGRKYTAKTRQLRVTTKWQLHEASVVPIGADQKAKMRGKNLNEEVIRMDPKLRKYLESIGLRADATDEAAWQFAAKLEDEQRAQAQQVLLGVDPQRTEDVAPPPPVADGEADGDSRTDSSSTSDPEEVAQRAVTAERERVRQVTDLAGDDVSDDVRQQAINEGWDMSRASTAFLADMRENRQTEPQSGTPYHHTSQTGSLANAGVRGLAAGLLISQGMDPVEAGCRMHNGRNIPLSSDVITAEDCDRGSEFRRVSAIDLVRECARLDTGRLHWDPEEAFRAAVSGGTLSYVFSTNVYAVLMAGWETVGDSTVGWCDEEDVANFLQQEDISLEAQARLERLGRGDTAKDATISDTHETYKIARYAKKFSVDEQDVIDDRLGAIMRMPSEMGAAARDLRPDLVYSLMLENPALVADSGAVFNATAVTTSGGHANLGTATLTSTALKSAITAMVQQRLGRTTANPGKALNIRPKFLIVPADLEWQARELTSAASLLKLFADSSDPFYAALNLIAKEGLQPVVDDRIGAIGVTDPRSGSSRTGSATNWFMTSGPNRGLKVAYRRGTGRQPAMRSFVLDRGQWGIGWDINMDIGAAFMDYRTWYKSAGSA